MREYLRGNGISHRETDGTWWEAPEEQTPCPALDLVSDAPEVSKYPPMEGAMWNEVKITKLPPGIAYGRRT